MAAWLVTGILPCNAQQRTVERLYMATDRALYVSGENIWLSLYCFDMSGKTTHLSDVSSVAYVELRNGPSVVSTAKLRIDQGRGSGKITIPPAAPTGNYRLIAYTKQMANEETLCCFDRVIPICNTLSMERIPQNVLISTDTPVTVPNPSLILNTKHIEIEWGSDKSIFPANDSLSLSIYNKSNEAITMSISIARMDVPAPQEYPLLDFLANKRSNPQEIKWIHKNIPEYEGEIIRGKVSDVSLLLPYNNSIFLSAVGPGLEIYASTVDPATAEFSFFTNSIYGNREIVLECPAAGELSFEIIDPFVKPAIDPVPPLYLDDSYASFLVERSLEMQVGHRFGIDTLFEKVIIQDDPLLYNSNPVVYRLDDYTRFPAMQDIMIEFVSELRFRKVENQSQLQVFIEEEKRWSLSGPKSLVAIDGIAIFDHDRLLKYDPLKVKTISIHRNSYAFENHVFEGVAQFNTYTGKYPGLTLGNNSLILDFQGVQYPCRFTGREIAKNDDLPDLRSLLYWDPQVDLGGGGNRQILLRTSSMPGRYAIIMEGITVSGAPVCYRSEFTVQ